MPMKTQILSIVLSNGTGMSMMYCKACYLYCVEGEDKSPFLFPEYYKV